MASIPTPRSFPQILGDQVDVFLSKFGIPKLKVGSPVLSMLEAASMSDLRNTQDIFDLLNSTNLDSAAGVALERQAVDEDLTRRQETSASGPVTIGDSRFSKISTKIYSGKPAPIVGSDALFMSDASEFDASGDVYVGRGTPNSEGPLTYTSKVDNGGYWTLNLDVGSHTQRFHNIGEAVVFAQGGNRTIGAGAVVQTGS